MKKSKFTEAQIAFVLKQAEDGTPKREAGLAEELGRYGDQLREQHQQEHEDELD
jgi:hypothetical protein